jgi:hypothetical protein
MHRKGLTETQNEKPIRANLKIIKGVLTMKFTSATLPSEAFYKSTKNIKFIEDFRDSGLHCAKVEEYTHKDAYCCASSLKNTIKKCRITNIECRTINGEVYLINRGRT